MELKHFIKPRESNVVKYSMALGRSNMPLPLQTRHERVRLPVAKVRQRPCEVILTLNGKCKGKPERVVATAMALVEQYEAEGKPELALQILSLVEQFLAKLSSH